MNIVLFDITFADGHTESVHVDSERVLVGSAAHCEIRLPMDVCAPEHLVFEIVGESIRLEELAYEPEVTLDGKPVSQATLKPDSVVRIGATQIRVSRTEVAQDARLLRKKEQRKSSLVRVLALGLAAALVGVLMIDRSERVGAAPAAVPALWGPPVTACPVSAPSPARAMAMEKRIVADGKRERHPFYIAEGVDSVVLYETVAACFRVAGEAALGDEMSALARDLRGQVEGEYRMHRLRLEHALDVKDDATTAREVDTLRSLMVGKQGQYVEWLNVVARRLNSQKAA